MPTDGTDHYRFGYSPEELERLGKQHEVWAEDNRRFLKVFYFRSNILENSALSLARMRTK